MEATSSWSSCPRPRPRRRRPWPQKLRELIEGHTFLQEEGINARLGVSIGVASYPTEASTKELLVRLADQRMYGDKEVRGKGR